MLLSFFEHKEILISSPKKSLEINFFICEILNVCFFFGREMLLFLLFLKRSLLPPWVGILAETPRLFSKQPAAKRARGQQTCI